MRANKRSFEPFLLDAANLGHTVRGFEPKKKGIFGGESDVKLDIVDDLDQTLNKTAEEKRTVANQINSYSYFRKAPNSLFAIVSQKCLTIKRIRYSVLGLRWLPVRQAY